MSRIVFTSHGAFGLRKMKNLRPPDGGFSFFVGHFSVSHGREEIDNFRNKNLHRETIKPTSRETDFTFCPKLKITHLKPIYPDQHLVFPSLSFLILSRPCTVTPISFPKCEVFLPISLQFRNIKLNYLPPK